MINLDLAVGSHCTKAVVSSTFSLFDFAKQMADASQSRKGVAFSTSSGAVQGRAALGSPFLFCQAFFFAAILAKKKAL